MRGLRVTREALRSSKDCCRVRTSCSHRVRPPSSPCKPWSLPATWTPDSPDALLSGFQFNVEVIGIEAESFPEHAWVELEVRHVIDDPAEATAWAAEQRIDLPDRPPERATSARSARYSRRHPFSTATPHSSNVSAAIAPAAWNSGAELTTRGVREQFPRAHPRVQAGSLGAVALARPSQPVERRRRSVGGESCWVPFTCRQCKAKTRGTRSTPGTSLPGRTTCNLVRAINAVSQKRWTRICAESPSSRTDQAQELDSAHCMDWIMLSAPC